MNFTIKQKNRRISCLYQAYKSGGFSDFEERE